MPAKAFESKTRPDALVLVKGYLSYGRVPLLAVGWLEGRGFIDAVNRCPDYGSDAYLSALREANGGHQIPLRTWDECRSERKSWGRET